MRAEIRYHHTSPHEYNELSGSTQLLLRKALEAIAQDPLHPPKALDVVRIRDYPGYWRLAISDHRIIYRATPGLIEIWFIEVRTSRTYERLGELR